MAIGSSRLIGIEGAHGSGKSTLALAVTAAMKARGVHAAYVPDAGRSSPLLAAAVRRSRPWDLSTQIQLVASQLAAEQEAALEYRAVVCDRTVLGWLAYARLVQVIPRGASERAVALALEDLCTSYLRLYDAMFLLTEYHDPRETPDDTLRPSSPEWQRQVLDLLQGLAADLKVTLTPVPPGLSLHARTAHVLDACEPLFAARG
jgi:predicted ATPase